MLNAAKFLDSSIRRLRALPKTKQREGVDKRSVRFSEHTKKLVVEVHQFVKTVSSYKGKCRLQIDGGAYKKYSRTGIIA